MPGVRIKLAGALVALAMATGVPAPAAESPASPAIAAVREPADAAAFWARVAVTGAPLVEPGPDPTDPVTVTFLWRSATAREVEMNWPVWTPDRRENHLRRLGDSDIWYRTVTLPPGTRLSYQIAVDPVRGASGDREAYRQGLRAALRPDPLNRVRMGEYSLLELPGAVPQPYVAARPGLPRGRLAVEHFHNAGTGRTYEVTLYRPPGVPDDRPTPMVVVFDAERYLTDIPTPTILDNLIADGAIPPVSAAMIRNADPRSRGQDLACNTGFADMLARYFMPWVRTRLRLTGDPGQIVLAGSSYGGLISTCAALRHPGSFGAVLSQSGSYWWDPPGAAPATSAGDHHVIRQVRDAAPLPIRFYLDAGLLERRPGPDDGPDNRDSILLTNRALAATLRDRGYNVTFHPFAGGHDDAAWRGTLSDGLIHLLHRPASDGR